MTKSLNFIFVFLLIRFGFAQNDIYRFSHINDANGLSQNSVEAIHQDKLGQIWIGTRDGLNKYDGEEFKVYRHQKDDSISISNNGILCIEGDKNGFIWIGTSFGLNRLNPKKNIFKSYFFDEKARFLGNNAIKTVKEISNNNIWIGTLKGVSIYDEKTDTFQKIINNYNVTTILETKSGNVFIGTTKGVLKVSNREIGSTYKFEKVIGTETIFVQDLVESSNGNILIGSQTKSVLQYDISKNTIAPYFDEFLLKGKDKNVRKLLFDDNGKLWIATYNGLQIADGQNKIDAFYNNDNDDKSINDNFIKTLFKDNTGVVWVGTYYGGLNICSDFNKNFINITQRDSKSGLSFKVVSSIDNYKNLLFFGTEGGGISILNTETNAIEHITTKNSKALKSDNIKSLYVTNHDKLWIGTFNKGLAIYNLKTKEFEKLLFPKRLQKFLKNVGVLSIVQYDNDNILLGTNFKGLIKYNRSNNRFSVFDTNSKPIGLTSNNVKTLKVDSKGNIWVGTIRGLSSILPNGEVRNHVYETDLKVKFEINTIHEDSKGVLWVGTFEDGLFKYENNQFESVELKVDKVEINGVRSIEKAEKGKLWISTHTQGILKYNPSIKQIESYYTKKEGLASDQFNRDASLRLGKSNYYFGGPSGVTFFDESKLTKNTYSPQAIITDFKIKNTSVEPKGDNQLIENTISYTKKIELAYNQGNFSLSFAIPNFINAGSNSYLYRLKGLESDWVKSSSNTAFYTIQKPGDYTFEVKGVNSDGVVNNNATSLQIHVNPAPWFTWWAYSLYFIICCVAFYYLFTILKSKTKLKHQLELEHVKTVQIEKNNKSKLEFFTNISHEFRTPLTLISGPLQQVLENYRGSSEMFKKLKVIESNTNQLMQLINRLMDFRKYENKLMKLEASEQDVVSFVEEIYLSFSEYAKSKNYEYFFHTSSNIINVYFDKVKLESVFFNLLTNAFKYTPEKGVINVDIVENETKVIISIKDTGVGIPKKHRSKIFERFYEISNDKVKNDYNKGTGIGLSIVKNIVDLHKGNIKLESSIHKENSGSTFYVEIFKGRKHLGDHEIVQDNLHIQDVSTYENQLKESASFIEDDNYFDRVHSKEKATILLVEDNEELRVFMRNFLIEKYNVYEAENGKEGYKKAIQERVDIIVSDVVMPITSGTELCTLIKEDIRTSHIPVILLTTRSSLMYKLEGLENGADDYLSKPFNVKEFQLRISNMLKSIDRLKEKITTHPIEEQGDIEMSSLDEKLYKKALQIIENNISNEQFDILFFCEELGVSKSVLFTKVKAWTNFTPKQFIKYIRLKRAATFLEQGKMTINQISGKVGFKNQKYFSKIFKSQFGKTPKEYQESFQAQ